jgi:outer membrane protein OmpA-like peptidoglycan-associated protein
VSKRSERGTPESTGDVTAEWTGGWASSEPAATFATPRPVSSLPGLAVGLVGLTALFGLGMTVFRERVEGRLENAALASLRAGGISSGSVEFVGRDATLVVPEGVDVDNAARLIRTAGQPSNASHLAGPRTVKVRVDPSLPRVVSASEPTGTLRATFTDSGAIELVGIVRSEEARREATTAAIRQLPNADFENSLTVGPDGYSEREAKWAGAIVGELRRVGAVSGDVELTSTQVVISGSVPSLAVRDAISAFAAGSSLSVVNQLSINVAIEEPVGPGEEALFGEADEQTVETQQSIDALLAAESISFRPASASLTQASKAMLAEIAKLLLADPGLAITLVGHTDNLGDPEQNLELSVQRAEAVSDELARLGVDKDRISASGQGDRNPIASNDSPAGRRQNRRIDIQVERK